jgi:hypothetical protein
MENKIKNSNQVKQNKFCFRSKWKLHNQAIINRCAFENLNEKFYSKTNLQIFTFANKFY